jgi:hypothetical protein
VSNTEPTDQSRTPRTRIVVLALAALSAIVFAGCGATAPESLVKQTGVHGDQLEKVYALYTSDPLSKASTRDLKDINAALAANDLKKATPGDVRRAEEEIQSRIKDVDEFVDEIRVENKKLKDTPLPDFAEGFESDPANAQFANAYTDTTKEIQRYTTADLAAAPIALTALERYLDFLEQWEEFLIDDDTDGLVAAGEKSDAAYKRLEKTSRKTKAREDLNKKITPLVDKMAAAASESAQVSDLVEQVKKQYPENFLSKHLKEK